MITQYQNFSWSTFMLALVLMLCAQPAFAQQAKNSGRWEKVISAFETSDSLSMPAPGGIVFTGSSSVRAWRSLQEDFAGMPVLNRGFGGSRIPDATLYFERIVSKYQPKQVVLYSGDNDIAGGHSPEMAFNSFKEFAHKMKQELPDSELLFLSIKPSISRWSKYPDMAAANKKIKRYAFWHRNVKFIDVANPMLGADGKPLPELFVSDGVHMTPAGYVLWTKILAPHLDK